EGFGADGVHAGLGRSVVVSRQYSALGSYGLHRRAAVLVWPAIALRRWFASAPPLSLQPGRARDALPLGQISADEGGKVLGTAAGHVEALPGQGGDDVGRFRRLVGGRREAIDDVARRA